MGCCEKQEASAGVKQTLPEGAGALEDKQKSAKAILLSLQIYGEQLVKCISLCIFFVVWRTSIPTEQS